MNKPCQYFIYVITSYWHTQASPYMPVDRMTRWFLFPLNLDQRKVQRAGPKVIDQDALCSCARMTTHLLDAVMVGNCIGFTDQLHTFGQRNSEAVRLAQSSVS